MAILDFFISHWKNWLLSRSYFGSWGHALVAIAVVEEFKQESMYGLCRDKKMAVVERWLLVEVRL